MHEMGIASSVLDAVRAESRRFPNGHVCKVGLRIGALAGVDPDSVSFCFDALVRDSELEPLLLEIEYRPRRHICSQCGQVFAAQDENTACPSCGSANALFAGGDELEIAFLEVEDGAAAARA
jgi:hydrogenase nickel incorporation protein HypA/HybF